MNLSIETSISLLSVFNQRLEHEAPHLYAAINNGIVALKTIQDGNYILKNRLNTEYGTMCYKDTDSTVKIDLKTLYEQTTMYCERIDTKLNEKYFVEIFQQPDTPIIIFAYWTRKGATKLHSIAYQIGEETT